MLCYLYCHLLAKLVVLLSTQNENAPNFAFLFFFFFLEKDLFHFEMENQATVSAGKPRNVSFHK